MRSRRGNIGLDAMNKKFRAKEKHKGTADGKGMSNWEQAKKNFEKFAK